MDQPFEDHAMRDLADDTSYSSDSFYGESFDDAFEDSYDAGASDEGFEGEEVEMADAADDTDLEADGVAGMADE
ncbi:MAG: hypothetical protein WBP72_16940, partial [Rhodocyclaceae bacterium]